MRTSVLAAGLGIAILAAGGAYYGLEIYPQQRFRTGLDQAIAALPAGVTVTYKDAHFSVTGQKAVITGLAIHAVVEKTTSDWTIASVAVSHPDFELGEIWNKAKSNPVSFAMETSVPVADGIEVTGLTGHGDMFDLTQDSFKVEKLRIYPGVWFHDGVPSFRDAVTALSVQTQPPSLDTLQPLLRLEAAAVLGCGYDQYRMDGMKLRMTSPQGEVSYGIQNMSGSGMDRGAITAASGEGVAMKLGPLVDATVDRISMAAFDVRDPATRLVKGEIPSLAMLDGIKMGKASYDGVTIRMPGKPDMRIGGLSAGPIAFAQGLPVSAAYEVREVRVDKTLLPDANSRDAFDKLGLQSATINFAVAYDFDVARKTVGLHDTSLKVNELGKLSLSTELNNVVAAADPGAAMNAGLVHAKLRLDDASLVERVLKLAAAQQGTDVPTFRRTIAAQLAQFKPADGQTSPRLTAATQALAAFIASPKSLTVELSPKQPVMLMAIQRAANQPARLAEFLTLTVTANAP